MTNETNRHDGVYLQHKRAVVVRIVSAGIKWATQDGSLRDFREHDNDRSGVEYEVELVDIENEVARLWLPTGNNCLKDFREGEIVAIGWKKWYNNKYVPIAWRTECYTPSS